MAIGPTIRQLLGPLEKPISDLYRGIFIDLTALVNQIKEWVPASNILELGCGEGAVVERLVIAYPDAKITGIDINPRVGRMFPDDLKCVAFKQQTIKKFAIENSSSIDLLIISDVMHHIPWEIHEEILNDARKTLKSGGHLVLKDWEWNISLIHMLCYLLDRYITGDRVRYKTANEFRELLKHIYGKNCIKAETRIRPWSNNFVFLVRL